MAGNSFGRIFTVTGFGESHGPAIGVVIDGCPSKIEVDLSLLRAELKRRKPGQSAITTSRNEEDEFEILSGVFEGRTLGTPIAVIVRNKDQKPEDYDSLKNIFRPSHADYTYEAKYGIRDYRGGGRQSARETISRVIAGAFAKMVLKEKGIIIQAYVSKVGGVALDKPYSDLDLSLTESNPVRCPDPDIALQMENLILETGKAGDSIGGVITCICKGVPPGLGEPVFDKLHADLGKAMMSINAVKGFEIGSGFASVNFRGSELNDIFYSENDKVKTYSNNSGGIQGGISNGEDIWFSVAFKPVASIRMEQSSVNSGHENVKFNIEGRHDPCVVPRAVPITEAMAAIVLCDHLLRS